MPPVIARSRHPLTLLRRFAVIGVGVLLVQIFAACTVAQRPESVPTTPGTAVAPAFAAPTASPLPRLNGLPSPSPSPATPDALVALAIADVSQRTGVDPSALQVVSVTPRDWPDRSLGCPKPGMGYAQVITPGYLIVLQAGGQQLEYHTDQAQVVLCEP